MMKKSPITEYSDQMQKHPEFFKISMALSLEWTNWSAQCNVGNVMGT